MLNHPFIKHPLTMSPDGSLNHLPINSLLLHRQDPLLNQSSLTGSALVSRKALGLLLGQVRHPQAPSVRGFLTHFDALNPNDQMVLELFATRFAAIIKTARSGHAWPQANHFQQALTNHWQAIDTLVISGGLTSHLFGLQLAEKIESVCPDLAVISSPWGGLTALYGLAQTVAQKEDLLVMDFGATGVKRGVATNYGNRLSFLPDVSVSKFKTDGLIRQKGLMAIIQQTRDLLPKPMPVAISLACYLVDGHPYEYRSGIYHRLSEDSGHLSTDMHEHWLPICGLSGLALLEHDSTAAALAFRFKQPAMMVTLGTGLGSAPCPQFE